MTSAQAVEVTATIALVSKYWPKRARDKCVVVVFECRCENEPWRRTRKLVHFSLQRDREHPVDRRKREQSAAIARHSRSAHRSTK